MTTETIGPSDDSANRVKRLTPTVDPDDLSRCGGVDCLGKVEEICTIAEILLNQANHGHSEEGAEQGTPLTDPEKVKNLSDEATRVLPFCAHPEQLSAAKQALENIIVVEKQDNL